MQTVEEGAYVRMARADGEDDVAVQHQLEGESKPDPLAPSRRDACTCRDVCMNHTSEARLFTPLNSHP